MIHRLSLLLLDRAKNLESQVVLNTRTILRCMVWINIRPKQFLKPTTLLSISKSKKQYHQKSLRQGKERTPNRQFVLQKYIQAVQNKQSKFTDQILQVANVNINYNFMLITRRSFILLVLLILSVKAGIVPTNQIMVYPNTENSPSLYLISFKTSIDLSVNEYILVNMDWLSTTVYPFSCALINSTIDIRCTNLVPPTAFTLGFTNATLLSSNPQLSLTRTIAIELLEPLPSNVEYFLEIGLLNVVENIKKISPSMEIYTIDHTGLIHEQNQNFGPVAYKPPITNVLGVTIYNDINNLALGVPGKLVTLKAQIRITVPVSTSLSSMFFVLQSPFQFSPSSYIVVDQAQQYATNPIALNRKPTLSFYRVITPHIFYVAFTESFLANRKFIVQITEIKNPFFIATSNVSIYTANFNSLTPLEAYESIFPLKTVTQSLSVIAGLPFDTPLGGPCVFYRSKMNYYKIKFNMPNDVPAGYAIKVIAFDNTIIEGSAYVDFESLNYTTSYDYFGSNYFIMRGMGPIMEGSLISILFKGDKGSITNFYISVSIDTEAIIAAGTASSYMFYGRADILAVDADNFLYQIDSSPGFEATRVDTSLTGSEYLRLTFSVRPSTSTGSYVEMYFSPEVGFDQNFDPNADCTFSGVVGTAVCSVVKTANYVYIEFKPSASYSVSNPNAFPSSPAGAPVYIQLRIFKIRFPRPSSPKYPYNTYFRLFNSSAANPTTYILADSIVVVPRYSTLAGVSLTELGNVNTPSTLNYPAFVRFQSKTPSDLNYILQENQVKVITIYSSYGFRGLGTYKNGDEYPCTSNIPITCIYRRGVSTGTQVAMQKFAQLERIDVFFKTPGLQFAQKFHIIIPDGINGGGSYYTYFYQIGIYNKLTKDYKYLYRNTGYTRQTNWVTAGANNQINMTVDFQGKAGSYRTNVTLTIVPGAISLNYPNYVVISSSWSLFQNGLSSYSSTSSGSANPTFYANERCPLSVKISSNMYMSIFPFQVSSSLATFNFYLDNIHMPYHYDLPNYYIFVISGTYNDMISSNQFEMTNQGIFYQAYLKSLTINCLENNLGVQNTICTIVFGTQSPLRANGKITFTFSGMNVATDECSIFLPNGTQVQSTCSSTSDNKNVTISMVDTYSAYHYPADNFTVTINGISIMAEEISQSVTVYLTDSTGKYIIERGNRILTTTVAIPQSIQIDEIVYKYLSPLSANKISIRFYLPRKIYEDERLGFIMGKDLSDVNSQLERLRIVLTRSDGLVLTYTNELISSEYKVLFTFTNSSQLIPTNYTLEIYGIMTPVSHQNGAFQIIYQRRYDKAYTLINAIRTQFPTFEPRISSNISMNAFFNTEGYEQKLVFTMVNTKNVVNSDMVWIVNFPSYYNEKLFNYNSYCMIDTTPIECLPDPTTPYQLIIRNSPKILTNGTFYTISVHRLACPRAIYTNDYYRGYYLFIGVLQRQSSGSYCQSALLYPEQAIQSTVNGILTVLDVTVNTLTKPTFSSIYAIIKYVCNVAIPASSHLFLIFPYAFDNFNNNNINIIFKIGGVILFSADATVIDRTLEVVVTSAIAANTQFVIEFPSLPTPKLAGSVKMSDMIGYITPANKKSILAASSISGNSAPILTFTADPLYLSFNHDNTIDITAGTYSQIIDITSSNGNPFLTNIVVNLTSSGFTFEPSTVFLKLGDTKAQFRVGADSGLFPVSYFYQTIKSQQVFTYYTITKNNNIRVTNNPIQVPLPATITIPIGGCSTPFIADIQNPPITDVMINFNYNNQIYNQSIFWPNIHTTKSQLLYSPSVTQNFVSFCVTGAFGGLGLGSSFGMRFVFAGTNYKSYVFSNQNVTINIVAPISLLTAPAVGIVLINRQKNFLDFNITPSVPGNIFYHFQRGQDVPAMGLTALQVYLKNNQYTLQSMEDFQNLLYVAQRDKRVGLSVRTTTSVFTLRISNLMPDRYYTLCMYLESFNGVASQARCLSVVTASWGVIMKAKIQFSSALNSVNMNKVLCYFAKNVNTQVIYAVDLQGNSCYNRAIQNLHYTYRGQTFTNENTATIIYIITSPSLTSDPAPTAFQNMYNSSSELSSASLSAALSGFAISYLSSLYLGSEDAIGMTYSTKADNIGVSFDQPVYSKDYNTISVPNVVLSGGYGSVYFVLILYKQVSIDGNNSYVKIRLNSAPTQQQILNCQNWQGYPAEGCARAIYSFSAQTVVFPNVLPNCMYMLYYMVASQYPLRPIVSSSIQQNSVVTFVFSAILPQALTVLALIMIILY